MHAPSLSGLSWWAALVVSVPTACAVVWYIAEKSLNTFAPYQWRYRPGALSAFFARCLNRHATRRRREAPVRVYMDGCFDMMHYGHANALRQAKALGDVLVLGLNSDEGILMAKGPPVMSYEERKIMVEAVKWVDEVIDNAPYHLHPDFLQELFTRHHIDFVVHGDDPCILPDGTDAYGHAREQGRFRQIKRTEGVSSTDIVGRMLMCTRDNARFSKERRELTKQFSKGRRQGLESPSASIDLNKSSSSKQVPSFISRAAPSTSPVAEERSPEATPNGEAGPGPGPGPGAGPGPGSHTQAQAQGQGQGQGQGQQSPPQQQQQQPPQRRQSTEASSTTLSRFMPTSRRIVQFSNGAPAPAGARVVYIDGAFDLFHPGHATILKLARAQGDFLLVGLHGDEDVQARRGPHLPLMDLHERALSVLACRYASEVIIGAPLEVTGDLLTTFNISLVVRGTCAETGPGAGAEERRYAVPRARGMFRCLQSPSDMTTATIIHRIVQNRAQYEARNAKKNKSEASYYANHKAYVHEV